jgi:hypothetical protein
VLIEDTLCYTPKGEDAVHIWNLRTAKTWSARNPTRGKILGLHASEERLAVAIGNVCVVSTLSGEKTKEFRIPNTWRLTINCRGRMVASAVQLQSLADGQDTTLVTIFDFDSGRARSVKVPVPQCPAGAW